MKCLLIKMSNEHISHLSRKKMKLVHSNVARALTKGLNKFSSNSIHMHTSDEISIIQLNKEMFTENVAFGASIHIEDILFSFALNFFITWLRQTDESRMYQYVSFFLIRLIAQRSTDRKYSSLLLSSACFSLCSQSKQKHLFMDTNNKKTLSLDYWVKWYASVSLFSHSNCKQTEWMYATIFFRFSRDVSNIELFDPVARYQSA